MTQPSIIQTRMDEETCCKAFTDDFSDAGDSDSGSEAVNAYLGNTGFDETLGILDSPNHAIHESLYRDLKTKRTSNT